VIEEIVVESTRQGLVFYNHEISSRNFVGSFHVRDLQWHDHFENLIISFLDFLLRRIACGSYLGVGVKL
jgi:hypothetical protein